MHTNRATSRRDSLASLRRKTLPLSLSLLLCGALASAPAQAGSIGRTTTPTGGSIVGGRGGIVQDGASVLINQASQKLALDWQSFDLGQDATVRFNQPGTSAVALNRILDQSPSQIFGQISSNGQVFLINTHGIIFGATARVNVGGLVASTLDLTPTDFLAGHFKLDKVGGGAGIVNHGTIAAASGGSVSLISGSVHNDGVILASYGRINLDGAEHAVLDFDGNGLINVQITGELKRRLDAKAAVDNTGTLRADGGTVVLEASAARDLFTGLVNNSGVIDAGAISHDGGVVRLVARGGDTIGSGSIDVTGMHGGGVQLLSDRNVVVTGDIDASGVQGGGRIRIGGGAQGGEGLLHASTSTVGVDARLSADAMQAGRGGSIVVWSDQDTRVAGRFSARGGVLGGDGGRVETSAGHVGIDDAARVSTLAPGGRDGTWLIDPSDFTIGPGGDMTAAAVQNALGSGNLSIQSTDGSGAGSGNILIESNLSWSAHTLTLTALNDIQIDAAVTTSGTAGLVLDAATAIGAAPAIVGGEVKLSDTLKLGGSGGLSLDGTLDNTGTLDISGLPGISIGSLDGNGIVKLGGATLTLSNAAGDFSGVIEGTGGLTIAGGSQTLSGANTYTGATVIGAGTLGLAGGGSIAASSGVTANGTLDVAGATSDVTIASLDGSGSVALGARTLTLDNASGDFGGVIGGSGGLILAGGTQTLGGANTYTGGTTLDGGVLTVSGDANLGAAGDLIFNGGTLATSAAFTSTRNVILQGNGTLQTGADLVLSGVIGGSGNLTKTGSGRLTLSGINTYTGATDIAAGTLALSGAGSLAASSGVTADGTFDISAAAAATIASLDGAGNVTLGAHTLTLANAAGSFDGAIAGTGGLVLAGGSQTLTGTNTYSGGTTISGGTLSIASNANLGATAGALTLDGGALENTASLALDRTLALGAGGGTLQTDAGTNLTLTGAVSGTGGLAQTGTGSLTLGGNVSTGGGQSYGKVLLGSDVTLTSGTGSVDFAGTVDNADATARTLTVNAGNGGVSFGGAVGGGANGRLAGLATHSQTFAADAIAVSGELLVTTTGGDIAQAGAFLAGGHAGFDAGSHAIALTNADNDFAGTVDLAGGTTAITDGNGLALGTLATDDLTVIGHGALDLGGGSVGGDLAATSNGGAIGQSGGLAVAGTSTLDAGANAITLDAAGNDFQGAVRLLNNGAYDVVLDNGSHALSMGTSTLGSGALSLAGNGITQTGGITQAAGAGAVTLQAGGSALVLDDGGNAFTGPVSAQGAGISLRTQGDLHMAALDAGTDGSVSLVAGGTLDLAALGAVNTGNGDLTLGAGGSFSTGADLGGRNVSLRGDGGLILSNNVTASGTLDLTSSDAAITQTAGTLVVAGATTVDAGTGTIGLTAGTNDFQGDLTVAGGDTTINDANQLTLASQDTGNLTITSHGNLVLGQGTVNGVLTASSNGGTISQASGGLTVTGTSTIDAGGGAITLADGNNDFGNTVGLNGSSVAIADKNALTLGGLTTGALSVTSHGDLALGASTISGTLDLDSNGGAITQAGVLTVTGTGTINAGGGLIQLGLFNDFQGTVNLSGGDAVVTDANALVLGTLDTGALTATSTGGLGLGSGSIGGDLTATSHGGAITQTGALDVQGASVLDAGSGAITLTDGGNHFAGAVSLTGAGIAVHDAGDLAVAVLVNQPDTGISLVAEGALALPAGAIDTGSADLVLASHGGALGTTGALSGANVSLSGRDGLTLADAVTAANTLTLASALGDVTQTAGTLTAAHLAGSAGGTVLLGQLNAIGQLDGFSAAGGFTLLNAGNLAIAGPVDGGNGVDITSGGLLTVAGDVSGDDITLQGMGISQSGGGIDAGNGQVSLQSGAGITQTGGSITAGTLTGSAVGDASLAGANRADALGSFSAANLSLTQAGSLSLAGPVTVTGTAALNVAGDLAINDTLSAASTLLDVGGAVTEGGGNLATGTLGGQAGGVVELTGSNHVDTLGNVTAAGFALTNAQALTLIGSLDVGTGDIALTTTSGALTVDSALSGGAVALDSAADLVLGQAIQGDTVSLESAGAISQTAGGLITAGTLGGHSGGSTVLDQGNVIAALGDFTASGFSLTSNRALTIDGTVDGGASTTIGAGGNLRINGTVQGDATALSAHGTISEGAGGRIVADTLTGQATGAATLDGANAIATLGNFQAAGLSLHDAQDLNLDGTIDGGASTTLGATGNLVVGGTIMGTTTRLDATGSLSEAGGGRIIAGTLNAHAGGSATLAGNNAVASLGTVDAAGLTFVNGKALTVAGTVDGGASTTLTTTAGGLTVNGALAGGATTLEIAGAIDQDSHGRITAGTLSGHAGGDVALDGDNRIDTLAAFSARDFALRNGKALAVNGPLAASAGDIALVTTAGTLAVNTALAGNRIVLGSAGDLALSRTLHGGAVTLQSGGRLSQTSGGVITADSLNGYSAGSTTLDQANAIGTLGNFSANGLTLTSTRALTVNGPVDGGASTTLASGGNLTIAGSLGGDTTTLAVSGAISEGGSGSLTAHTLSGHATGAVSLTGANRIDTLGAFTAAGFALSNGPTLTVIGPLDGGGSVRLGVTRGDLLINGKVGGKAATLTASGAIIEGQGGSIVADTLSGEAGGVTRLGTATSPLANYVGTLGGFSSRAGFSLTNAQTLTLASVGGSGYTVDAGTSTLYLAVTGGDLLQVGGTWLYDGVGGFSSTGRIGTADAPIYVTGTGAQAVDLVGMPPAYFYAVNGNGGVLPLTGGSSVNVPTSLFTSRAQNANNHTDVYIDPSVISANYRSFGIVPSGILLPPDQQACDAEMEECDE